MSTEPASPSDGDTLAHRALIHRVLPYGGAEEFLGGAVPFLRSGVRSGDRVLAACGTGYELLLRDALGPDADAVEFADAAAWYAHPARFLADLRHGAEAAAADGRRLRVLGEPSWGSRPAPETVEWQRAEALLNVALRGTGAALLCPYATSLPASIVAAGRKTHPETVRGARAVANPGFVDPWAYSAGCDAAPLPDPPHDAELLPIGHRPDLFWLRAYVADHARCFPLGEGALNRLLVAVTEVVTNAVRHGAPPIELRSWTEPDGSAFVCEVRDGGHWPDGPAHGLIPSRDTAFGLWAVRLLCSTVQVRTGEDGTAVRLRFTLPSPVESA